MNSAPPVPINPDSCRHSRSFAVCLLGSCTELCRAQHAGRRLAEHGDRQRARAAADNDALHGDALSEFRFRRLQSQVFQLHAAVRMSGTVGGGGFRGGLVGGSRACSSIARPNLDRRKQHLLRHHGRAFRDVHAHLAYREQPDRVHAAVRRGAARASHARKSDQRSVHQPLSWQRVSAVLSAGAGTDATSRRADVVLPLSAGPTGGTVTLNTPTDQLAGHVHHADEC